MAELERFQCIAAVLKRDTYRFSRSGRRSGFRMHYNETQCSRQAVDGGEYCRQHAALKYPPTIYRFAKRRDTATRAETEERDDG